MSKLQILGDDLIDEASDPTWFWLWKNILEPAGVSREDFSLTENSSPLMVMGKESIKAFFTKDKSVSNYHGSIERRDGRLVSMTYHPSSVRKNPNLLPVASREVSNLLEAHKNPSVLDRPIVHKGYIPYRKGESCVIDLEWDVKTDVTTVVGCAYSRQEAYSSYNVQDSLGVVRRHWMDKTCLTGHNICEADLPRILPEDAKCEYKPNRVFDTKIAAHLIHAHLAETGLLDLGSLTRFYFPTVEWKSDKDDILDYNGRDCAYNYRLAEALKGDLTITDQWHLMEKQQRLARMAYEMHEKGIKLNKERLWIYAKERAEQKASSKASFGDLQNPNSNPQIIEWFNGKFGISIQDCKYGTLEKWQGRDAELDRFIAYREDNKSLSTWFPDFYVKKKNKNVLKESPADCGEFSYPHFNVTGTAVARFSCADPNYQNLPRGSALRQFLVPRSADLELWGFDGKQIENRIVAWLANDTNMLEAFASGVDFHKLNAANILGKRVEDVSKEERQDGKTTTHATSYCESHYNLARRIYGNTKRDAVDRGKDLQNGFFKAYPRIKEWHGAIGNQLDRGDIRLRNPFGRVRYIYASDYRERQKRGAHFLGCSTAADSLHAGILRVWDDLRLIPLLIVHDEAVYEIPRGDLKTVRRIKELLELPIPEMGGFFIPYGAKRGPSYGELEEVEL